MGLSTFFSFHVSTVSFLYPPCAQKGGGPGYLRGVLIPVCEDDGHVSHSVTSIYVRIYQVGSIIQSIQCSVVFVVFPLSWATAERHACVMLGGGYHTTWSSTTSILRYLVPVVLYRTASKYRCCCVVYIISSSRRARKKPSIVCTESCS